MSQSKSFGDGTNGYAAALLALGRIPLATRPLGEVLEQVARLAKDTIPGVDDASVTLIKDARPHTAAFTGPVAIDLDERQYKAGFGPCLDAAISGDRIVIKDMSAERTYKEFAQAAARQGVTQSISLGLPFGSTTVGGINLYGLHSEPYDDSAVDMATTFAGYAAVALANAAALADAVEEAAGLHAAMETRAVIEQAKGILMRDQRCTSEEAFRLLAQASNNSNRKLRDIALSIVEGAQR